MQLGFIGLGAMGLPMARHLVEARPGYRWAPDHWEERGGQHHFEPGRLERDPDYHGRR